MIQEHCRQTKRTGWLEIHCERLRREDGGEVARCVFTHVAVIDTARAVAQSDQTVLVADDRISDVGPSNTVKGPDGVKVGRSVRIG